MISCYIQHLERHRDGWHIRFSGSTDDFWGMLSNFKREQKLSGQIHCYYNPKFFGKGGWFCSEGIFVKYADNFSNYADMRQKAIQDYQENGKAEEDRREAEAKEATRKAKQEAWEQFQREHGNRQQNSQQEKQKQRDQDWEHTQQRQQEEQTQQERQSRSRFTTSLTVVEALEELGLAPLTPISTLTEKQIKAAFRVKALKAHPDTGGSNQAFIRLNQAYQLVLIQVQQVGVR
jgi:flagellar biosynthesis GTPase FlhF